MSLAGLTNDNGFYSDHYLAEVFAEDIGDRVERWKAQAEGTQPETALAAGGGVAKNDAAVPAQPTPDVALRNLRGMLTDTLDEMAHQTNVADRLDAQRDWTRALTEALALPWSPAKHDVGDELVVPLLGELTDAAGKPLLWLLEAVPDEALDADPLTLEVHPAQLSDGGDIPLPKPMKGESWQALLAGGVFVHDHAPRWIVLAGLQQWLLLDRTKFGQGRLLRFDWVEILRRRETDTLRATAALLHRDSFLVDPNGATQSSLHETLEEKAHKHAYGVSEDLKYALRESIELLGNEAARQLVSKARRQGKGIFSGERELDAGQLTDECLRYLYRLLFLFYIEARPELGYAPANDDIYRQGYSLEHLRELELVELVGERERSGHYMHHAIAELFRLIDEGFEPPRQQQIGTEVDVFLLTPLKSHLFDPKRTPLLAQVMFPNCVLQRVIRLMSLTRPKKGKRRGRVSYARLGINQLGAVYEALLSFRGFFATEELFEVRKKGESPNDLDTGYFVNARALERYDYDEKVYVKNARGEQELKRHAKGAFIYRMAGRDRQQSASYYTPEVLTACLVKYALKELFAQQLDPLPDDAARAKHLLSLTICEPAMGSAAFLNEAVNQIADKYLELAQSAKRERIPQSEYAAEKQRVKMYLADHAVFGIDLNPVAVELAEVSLWLNALSDDRFVPWFGLQLHCGNSLVGARRETYPVTALARAGTKDADSWLNTAPDALPMADALPEKRIWHFLLPDRGMAKYDDKAIKERYPDAIRAIKKWNKEFTAKFDANEIVRLTALSECIELLWQEHAEALADLRRRTTDAYDVYGFDDRRTSRTTLAWKDNAYDGELLAKGLGNTNAYQRLRLVMNYWCALWFWPIDQHDELPSHEEWLFDLETLLLGDTMMSGLLHESGDLFAPTQDLDKARGFVNRHGVVDLDRLYRLSPRFELASGIADKQRFFHWEVEFADLFRDRGGFDLVLGNPPWIKPTWSESSVLGDNDPRIEIRGENAASVSKKRADVLSENQVLETVWREEFVYQSGLISFFGSFVNYPLLLGGSINYYKCFVSVGFAQVNSSGVSAFVHESGIFNESAATELRKCAYERLRTIFRFPRAMDLFGINGNSKTKYECAVYGPPSSEVSFEAQLQLGSPSEIIENSNSRSGSDHAMARTEHYSDRVLRISAEELKAFAALYDGNPQRWLYAVLPTISNMSMIRVCVSIARYSHSLSSLQGKFDCTKMWDETNAEEVGILEKSSNFPSGAEALVISGSHIYVGTLFYKCTKSNPKNSKSILPIDLSFIPVQYYPRTFYTYSPAAASGERSEPLVCWNDDNADVRKRFTDYYRAVNRVMVDPLAERSFTLAVIPPKVSHINSIFSCAFTSKRSLMRYASFGMSLASDFIIKARGSGNVNRSIASRLPVGVESKYENCLLLRALALTCSTSDYSSLWEECWNEAYRYDDWSSELIPSRGFFSALSSRWNQGCGLIDDLSRRQALIEIDVLVAMSLGIECDDLVALYVSQFTVLVSNESDTYYDSNGRLVFTCNRGLPGVGFPRKARVKDLENGISFGIQAGEREESGIVLGWEDIRDLESGIVTKTLVDDTLPDGPHHRTIEYVAPFFCPDREEDYRRAWEFFERKLKEKESADARVVA